MLSLARTIGPCLRPLPLGVRSAHTQTCLHPFARELNRPNLAMQRPALATPTKKVVDIFSDLQERSFKLSSAPYSRQDFKISSYSLEMYFLTVSKINNCSFITNIGVSAKSILEHVRVLLENGCKPTEKLLFDLLLSPSLCANRDKEQLLVELASHLESVNQKDESFMTLLDYAILGKYKRLAHVLLEKGADKYKKDQLGFCAWELTVLSRDPDLMAIVDPQADIKEELKHMNIEVLSYVYNTLTHYASLRTDPSFHLLIDGFLPNLSSLGDSDLEKKLAFLFKPPIIKDLGFEITPMYQAMAREDLQAVKELLEEGWSIPLELAFSRQKEGILAVDSRFAYMEKMAGKDAKSDAFNQAVYQEIDKITKDKNFLNYLRYKERPMIQGLNE